MELIWLPILFFFVALFYSSVGFGGGSSYLAILSIVLSEFFEIRSLALVLNLTVVSIGTFNFYRKKLIGFIMIVIKLFLIELQRQKLCQKTLVRQTKQY